MVAVYVLFIDDDVLKKRFIKAFVSVNEARRFIEEKENSPLDWKIGESICEYIYEYIYELISETNNIEEDPYLILATVIQNAEGEYQVNLQHCDTISERYPITTHRFSILDEYIRDTVTVQCFFSSEDFPGWSLKQIQKEVLKQAKPIIEKYRRCYEYTFSDVYQYC